MKQNNLPPSSLIVDLQVAASLLTRVPVGACSDPRDLSRSAWAWPLIGLAGGALAGLIGASLLTLTGSAHMAAFVALVVLIVLTGALHEDGLADSVDGLVGGKDRQACLHIMKDSQIGAFGSTALVMSLLGRWVGITMIDSPGSMILALAVVGAVSRAVMVAVAHLVPLARPDGLSAAVGTPSRAMTLIAILIALAASLALGVAGLAALIAASVITIPICQFAKSRIGGQTGDIIGATQQCSEVAALLVIGTML